MIVCALVEQNKQCQCLKKANKILLNISNDVVICLSKLSDTGLYTCVATSSSGETSWSAFLDVRGQFQQRLLGWKMNTVCYMKHRKYLLLLCCCRNLFCLCTFPPLSDSTDLVEFMSHNATALPGPSSKPEVTDVTKSSISLSWEPGPEAGSPVSSYVIEAFGYVCDLWPQAAFSDPEPSWQ